MNPEKNKVDPATTLSNAQIFAEGAKQGVYGTTIFFGILGAVYWLVKRRS